MKKLKLLFAACALLLGVSNVMAQKDVTSQYITNAKLSDGTNGWTKTCTKTKQTSDPADAFSNSVRGNNTVGYASEAYAGWGELIQTDYSMKQTITLPAGSYRLVCYSFFRQGDANDAEHNSKSLAYVVAGENKTLIKTLRSITAAGYANSQAEGANCFDSKMYRNVVEFTVAANNTDIEIGVEGTFDEMRSWCIVGMFELFDLNDLASVSSPTDVTYAITNSGFEYRDLTGWTNNGLKYQNNNWANKSGIGFAEQWVGGTGLGSNKSMTQTLTNMPAGLYELSVYAQNVEQYNSDAAGTGMFLTANSDQIEIGAFGLYKVRTTLTQDGDITIGINLDNCTGNWVAFDRFGLQFYGDPMAAYQELLDATVSEAQAIVDGGTIPASAASALQQVINDNDNDDHAFTEESQFNAAIAAIQAAENTANALVSPYAEFNAMKVKAQALQAVANDNVSANATLADAITTQSEAVEEATTAEAVNTVTSTLKEAMKTYVFVANPVGNGSQFDCTFLMTNPDLTGLPTWQKADGWTTEQADGNYQVMTNDAVTSLDGTKTYFYEYWSYNAKSNDKFNLYNAVTLPEGTYTMSCYAFAKQQDGEAGKNPIQGVYFYANNTQGDVVADSRLTQKSISFVNNAEQEVKIGLKPLSSGNTYNWMGIGYVELYKVPAQVYEVSENANYDNTQSGAGDVTLNRSIKAGFNTLVLPFSMNQAEVEEQFGAGSEVYELNSFDGDVIRFQKVDGISPNKPCILKATEEGNSYEIEGRTIVAGEAKPTATAGAVSLIGNYASSLNIPYGEFITNYVVSDGKLFLVDSDVTINGTRAYFNVAADNNTARTISLSFDDEVTGIATVENGEVKKVITGDIYDLQGRKVKNPSKGIYVVEGKKVVF